MGLRRDNKPETGKHPFRLRVGASTSPWARLGGLLGSPVMEREHEAADAESAARAQLRTIAAELEGIRFRLLGVHASLAADSKEGRLLAGQPRTEVSSEVLSAIECVLIDRIGPALHALQEAVREVPPAEGAEEGQ